MKTDILVSTARKLQRLLALRTLRITQFTTLVHSNNQHTIFDRHDVFQLRQHVRLNVNTAATNIASVLNDTCCLVFD